MSRQRGRIRVSGFDTERVREREPLSDWSEATGTATEGRWVRAWRDFRHNRSAMLGLAVVATMTVLTVFARPVVLDLTLGPLSVESLTVQPFAIAPYDPTAILYLKPGLTDVGPYQPPSGRFLMGTDGSARDLFSRVLYGGRFSISIGFVVVTITALIGIVYGGVSGYYGGWVDEVMMRITDVVFAFPGLVLALVIVSMLGGGYWQLVLAFVAAGWAGYGRLIRAEVLSVKENEYVLAAKALGATDRSVIFRHIVPNTLAPVVVQASLSVGTVVIGVAALGFLGLGFPPGTPEWGTMLDQTRETLIQGPGGSIPWWATVFPGGAIFLFVMSMNLIGDGINDALDAQEGTTVTRGGGG